MIVDAKVTHLLKEVVSPEVTSYPTEPGLVGLIPYGMVLEGDLPDGVVVQGSPVEIAFLVGALPSYIVSTSTGTTLLGGKVIIQDEPSFEEDSKDIVQLRSSGPDMTVVGLEDGFLRCAWFSPDGIPMRESFPRESLVKVKAYGPLLLAIDALTEALDPHMRLTSASSATPALKALSSLKQVRKTFKA